MSKRRLLSSLDFATIATVLALVCVGLLAIASATLEQAEHAGLWKLQLLWVLVGVAAAAVIVIVDYHAWAEIAYLLHGAVIALLIAVLFVGKEVAGNRSWLVLSGLRVQPAELAKWTTCLLLAVYLSRRVRASLNWRQLIEMTLIVMAPVALIAAQPDMGTALIFLPILLVALLVGGLRWKVLVGLLLAGLLLMPLAWTQLEPYQQERVMTVLDPGRDPSGVGYQMRQSKIAIGSGGLSGKGLFGGTQSQLNFLPAQHTDFIMAVFAEELGFIGVAVVLVLFYHLLHRGIVAARSSKDRLGTCVCLLVVAWITGQLTINVGMVLGRLPTIGVPLPFLSYGGSALLAALCGVGLIVNVRARRFVN